VAYVPPAARTEVEGNRVKLARRETRRGVPAKLESGGQYRDVFIDRGLVGEEDAGGNETELRATAATGAVVSRVESREAGERDSELTGVLKARHPRRIVTA
jgi:hypothetical protein